MTLAALFHSFDKVDKTFVALADTILTPADGSETLVGQKLALIGANTLFGFSGWLHEAQEIVEKLKVRAADPTLTARGVFDCLPDTAYPETSCFLLEFRATGELLVGGWNGRLNPPIVQRNAIYLGSGAAEVARWDAMLTSFSTTADGAALSSRDSLMMQTLRVMGKSRFNNQDLTFRNRRDWGGAMELIADVDGRLQKADRIAMMQCSASYSDGRARLIGVGDKSYQFYDLGDLFSGYRRGNQVLWRVAPSIENFGERPPEIPTRQTETPLFVVLNLYDVDRGESDVVAGNNIARKVLEVRFTGNDFEIDYDKGEIEVLATQLRRNIVEQR